jgi:hypothetical protein
MFNIFDQPWTLAAVSALLLLVVWIIRAVLPKAGRKYYLIPAIIFVAAFVIELGVQTDTEKIVGLMKKSVQAVEDEDVNAIEPLLNSGYKDSLHKSRQDTIEHLRRFLVPPMFIKNVGAIVSLDIESPRAELVCTVRMVFDKRSQIAQWRPMVFVKLRYNCAEDNAGNWSVSRIELLELDRQPFNWSGVVNPAGSFGL